jgi:hypothetical protein
MQVLVTYIYPYRDDGNLFLLQEAMEEILRISALHQVSNALASTIKKYRAKIYHIEKPGDGRLCLEMTYLHNLPQSAIAGMLTELNGLGRWSRVGSMKGVYIVIGTMETI